MSRERIVAAAKETLGIMEELINDVEIPRVSFEQELEILGQMAPVILTRLLDGEDGES